LNTVYGKEYSQKHKPITARPIQGFQNNPAAAGAMAGSTRFTAGYFV
jgi:hypothetical protein